jgi:hypothetical protein
MEYEDGTEEIGIEFAAIDISLHPAFNLRSGIITNPIGAFNQNHDGPKWEFVERPDVAVNLLAATWANAGFGMYGKTHHGDWILGYEAYLSNGFDNNIVDNDENKTFLPAAKGNGERFEESNSGKPLLTAKAAVKNRKIGEVGFSYMGGVYNQFNLEGSIIAPERRVDVVAIDFNTTIQKTGTYIVGEAVLVHVGVPETHSQQYGETQRGAFVDIVQPILKKSILDWDNAVLNLSARLDYVDWNVGTYEGLDDANIGDELWAITPAVSFRPTAQTVIRANYRYQLQNDILSNPAAISASFTVGFSTYF